MVSQREKLERIETVLSWIEEETGVKYTVEQCFNTWKEAYNEALKELV
jgi:hypothetical protein